MEVEYCADTYCACPNAGDATIEESVRFILTQFGYLNIGEIREAFRLAASGKIQANLNAYHGQFSVRLLGEVLSNYADYRSQIAREVRNRQQAAEFEKEQVQRAEVLKEKHGTIEEQLAALQQVNHRYTRWQDLPYWFCRRVIEDNLLGITQDRKGKVWIEVKQWAVNQAGFWSADPNNTPVDFKRYRAACEAIQQNPDVFPEELKPEAEEAYAKRLVFENIAEYTEE